MALMLKASNRDEAQNLLSFLKGQLKLEASRKGQRCSFRADQRYSGISAVENDNIDIGH